MTRSAALRVAVIVVLLAVLAGGIAALVAGGGSSGGIEITVPPADGEIRVHVAGAVAREGVYDLRRGDRVIEAVEAAGGLLDDADTASLNLAARLTDGERIDIPRLERRARPGGDPRSARPQPRHRRRARGAARNRPAAGPGHPRLPRRKRRLRPRRRLAARRGHRAGDA